VKIHPSYTNEAAPETKGATIRWARHYDLVSYALTLGKERQIRQKTVDLAGLKPGERALEVGCGTGSLALVAKGRVGAQGQVAGIDAAPEMIAVARQKAARSGLEIEFRVGLIEALSFPDGSFDAVLSSLMMHHLPGDLKEKGLAEVRRVLKPGGRLLIVDMRRPESRLGKSLLPLLLHRRMPVGVQDLDGLMKDAGFVDIQSGNAGFLVLGYVRGFVPAAP
jgi:demethylmenaquinone methyltransferase/2-methoxy-6-polyprenyl-1,4-benzoquinol methylase/phosphoethanolamine N-methyltransferase